MSQTISRYPTVFSNVGHTYTHLFMLLYPTVVLALERQMDLSYGELLTLALPGTLLFGAGALPAGWLGDRWSSAAMMSIFFLGIGCAALLTALAQTPLHIALGLSLLGLFASIYHPVGMAMLVNAVRNKGRALGINGVFGNLGTATAALVAAALTDLLSWRAAFYVPGILALLTGLLFMASLRRVTPTEQATARQTNNPGGEGAPARRFLTRLAATLVVTMICSGLIYQATSISMPKVFSLRLPDLGGQGMWGIGGLVTVVYLSGGMAQLLGGYLADKLPARQLYSVSFALQVPVLALAVYVQSNGFLLVATSMVFLNVLGLPLENALIARYTPQHWRATAYGAKFVIAIGISALGVPLVAYIFDHTGSFAALFIIEAILAVVAMLAVLLVLPGENRPTLGTEPSSLSPAVGA